MANDNIKVDQDYVDNYAIKEFALNSLVGKYFNSIDVSQRNIGLLGYVTELVGNTVEDVFNATSVLFREAFPNRAQLTESIYSHAAVFQLDDLFSTAATCTFMLVLDESAVLKGMTQYYDSSSGLYHFYIDKNTVIYVEDIPYSLDYDIRIDIAKKTTENKEKYIYTAKYITDDYSNTISSINDPYIKLRTSSGLLALEVTAHQVVRDVKFETILTDTSINYPIIDVDFEGKIAGFDILYKGPSDASYEQIEKLLVYSQAIKSKFCYYQLVNDKKLRITFNTKENYFTPAFNSEIKIIVYKTLGADGNFDVYNGTNITIVPDNETYSYPSAYLITAQNVGGSLGGLNQKSIEDMQRLAIQGYRTANALTTESDLQQFFYNNASNLNGVNALFIKRRDDIYERVYSAFIVLKDDTFTYKCNTLKLNINLNELKNPEDNVYILEPGVVLTANENDGIARFLRDEDKWVEYLESYEEAKLLDTIPYIQNSNGGTIPAYLDRACSYAEYKKRIGVDDKKYIFDMSEEEIEKIDDPSSNKFALINPFLIKFNKTPNLVTTYLTNVSNTVSVDFADQNDDSLVQFTMYTLHMDREFTKEKKYHLSIQMAPTIDLDAVVSPIKKIDDKTYNVNNRFTLKDNDLRVLFVIKNGINDICYTEMTPTEYDPSTNNMKFECDIFTDDHITSTNKLRILQKTIYRKDDGTYYEVHSDDATVFSYYEADGTLIDDNVIVDTITGLLATGEVTRFDNTVNMTTDGFVNIPLNNVVCEIYTIYNRLYSSDSESLEYLKDVQTNNKFIDFDSTMNRRVWTNIYSTQSEPLVFIKPLDCIRTSLEFSDYTETDDDGEYLHDIMDCEIGTLNLIRANTYFSDKRMDYFIKSFLNTYDFLNNIIHTSLRNETNIDIKFYNTYGRSRNFTIGKMDEIINTVNISIALDVWFVNGTDTVSVIPEMKSYIKEQIESIDGNGQNAVYISNLMKALELKFPYIDHIVFKNINKYNSSYQSIKNTTIDIDELTVDERREYVPELIVCDTKDISITEYTM